MTDKRRSHSAIALLAMARRAVNSTALPREALQPALDHVVLDLQGLSVAMIRYKLADAIGKASEYRP